MIHLDFPTCLFIGGLLGFILTGMRDYVSRKAYHIGWALALITSGLLVYFAS